MQRRVFQEMKKAVILLSGGLDSATVLYYARSRGFKCYCIIFDYCQRHKREIASARAVAKKCGCRYQVVKIALPWKGSSLLDKRIPVLAKCPPIAKGIPGTYVPGRNIIFLSLALSYAETIKAQSVFIGANAIDYSGYPDCRPEFYQAYIKAVNIGTKAGCRGKRFKILTPLINLTKSRIIQKGIKLGVPYELTWSCYLGGKNPCGLCDSCCFRDKGFKGAGVNDPLLTREP